MEMLTIILITAQLVFTVTAFIYFFNSVKSQSTTKNTLIADSRKESKHLEELKKYLFLCRFRKKQGLHLWKM